MANPSYNLNTDFVNLLMRFLHDEVNHLLDLAIRVSHFCVLELCKGAYSHDVFLFCQLRFVLWGVSSVDTFRQTEKRTVVC